MSHQLIVAIGRESGSGGLDIAHALAERRIYHDQHCKGDWGDAKCYDLVINSARLDIPGTVDILEQYIRSRAAQLDDRPAGE